MSNICDNTFYAFSESVENIDYIKKFFYDNKIYDFEVGDPYNIDAYFTTDWVFDEKLMDELYDGLPNKEDIYMRCLSVEYGCMYHALWYCDEDGWHKS